jgi:hypothetical protein
MPLTAEEMKQLIVQLENICREAQELQGRIRAAMVDRARRDLPVPQRQPSPRRKMRKVR